MTNAMTQSEVASIALMMSNINPEKTPEPISNENENVIQKGKIDIGKLIRFPQKHFEYLKKLETIINISNEPDFIKTQMKSIFQNDIIKIYEKKTGASGLENFGMTCYLNSVLQCLRHTILFNSYLFGGRIEEVITKNQTSRKVENTNITLLINYMWIVITLWDNDNTTLSPLNFKTLFSHNFKQFSNHMQHDAHECLVTVLDSFHDTLSRNVKYKITGEVINDLDKQIKQAHEDWAIHYKRRHSAVLDIFSGQLQTKTVCPKCQQTTYRYDPIMAVDLPLPETTNENQSIYECFNNYVEPAILTSDNLYYCTKCKDKMQAFQVHSIWTLPNVLIIKLSRFKYTIINDNYSASKVMDFINYPIKDLDLAQYISSPLNKQTKYDLYGVICHEGDPERGHYYSYCNNQFKQKWYKYNDESATEIPTNAIVTKNAYVLFYQRQL